jgi:hypothetical protein
MISPWSWKELPVKAFSDIDIMPEADQTQTKG